MKRLTSLFLAAIALASFVNCSTRNSGKEFLPDWQEGYLDIHQISTGRGNAALIVMPDGTNMIVDCGDNSISKAEEHNEVSPVLPNDSKHSAEWVADYFKHFAPQSVNNSTIDYALITHYHIDHMGATSEPFAVQVDSLPFILNGITELGVIMPISTLINRSDIDNPLMPDNYRSYICNFREPRGLKTESLRVGQNDQIVLLHSPEKYPSFEVRNVIASRTVWSGQGEEIISLGEEESDNENANSCGVVISFGDFDFLTCGDIPGTYPEPDGETMLAKAVGECDIAVACHHGYQEAMNPFFCSTLDPIAFIVPTREYWHPSGMAVETMCNEALYSGKPQIFTTGMLESTRQTQNQLGFGEYFMPEGHVVVRVKDGGSSFRIFVLNDKSEDREIIYTSPEYKSRN